MGGGLLRKSIVLSIGIAIVYRTANHQWRHTLDDVTQQSVKADAVAVTAKHVRSLHTDSTNSSAEKDALAIALPSSSLGAKTSSKTIHDVGRVPSLRPTAKPTAQPTKIPTIAPVATVTRMPTRIPTLVPANLIEKSLNSTTSKATPEADNATSSTTSSNEILSEAVDETNSEIDVINPINESQALTVEANETNTPSASNETLQENLSESVNETVTGSASLIPANESQTLSLKVNETSFLLDTDRETIADSTKETVATGSAANNTAFTVTEIPLTDNSSLLSPADGLVQESEKSNLTSASVTNETDTGTMDTQSLSSNSFAVNNTTLEKTKKLPIRNETGLIMVYIHIPKTGGTSIRKMFNPFGKVFFAWGKRDYHRMERQMDNMIDSWKDGSFAFFELHGGDAIPFTEFSSKIKEWRKKASDKGIPLFAFTIVREPVSFAVSSFAYYHTQHIGGFQNFRNPTEKHFLAKLMPSPQCLFLTRTEDAYREESKCKDRVCGPKLREGFAEIECIEAYSALQREMDWVGLTKRLSTDTFPLLKAVMDSDKLDFKTLNSSGKKKLSQSDLSENALADVMNATRWDKRMYEQAGIDFQMKMWNNFPTPTGVKGEGVEGK